MFSLKKKLSTIIPGEGARGTLQNMLTVEWEGHKTVLVEVPPAGPSSRSNDVELSGLGSARGGRGRDEMEEGLNRSYGGYGKLSDDDEEYGDSFNTSRMSRSHHAKSFGGKYLEPPVQLTRGKTAPSTSRPSFNRPEFAENPFESPYSSSDYLPSQVQQPNGLPKSHSYGAPSRRDHTDWDGDYFSHQKSASTNWTLFDRSPMEDDGPRMGSYSRGSKSSSGKSLKPDNMDWKADPWSRGSAGWSETTSPTSSSGSVDKDAENPFGDN